MKTCPTCGNLATDETQSYCLMDGSALIDDISSEPTLVIGGTRPTVTTPGKNKRNGMLLGLALLGLTGLSLLIAGLMYVAYRMGSESAAVKVNVGNNAATPRMASTPRQAAPAATPSPTPQSSPGDDVDQPSNEPTPITWTTSGSTFKNDAGLRYTFMCPADGTAGMVWGSDIYTSDSSICTAAVHAGKITLEKGGEVTIEFTGGRQTYGATVRNGITSYNFGQFQRSYVFKDGGKAE